MPKENFWNQEASEGDKPDLTVTWGCHESPHVEINGIEYDRSGLNRLISALRRARDKTHGSDA